MLCLPSGKLVQLEVHHFIPYLRSTGEDEDSAKLAAPAIAALLPFLEKSHGAEAAKILTERMCAPAPTEEATEVKRSCFKPAKLPIPILPPTVDGFVFVKGTSKGEERKEATGAGRPGDRTPSPEPSSDATACPGEEQPSACPRVPSMLGSGRAGAEDPEVDDEDDDGIIRDELSIVLLVENALPDERVARIDHRALANHPSHLLTHLPNSPYCQTCQLAKMCNLYTKRGRLSGNCRSSESWLPVTTWLQEH